MAEDAIYVRFASTHQTTTKLIQKATQNARVVYNILIYGMSGLFVFTSERLW
jgi:hypothetical protein